MTNPSFIFSFSSLSLSSSTSHQLQSSQQSKSSSFRHTRSSCFLFFQFFLFLLFISSVSAQSITNGASSNAVVSVVFTRWRGAPRGWTKYIPDNLTSDPSPPRWLRSEKGAPRAFNFLMITFSMSYTHSVPSPGDYLIRFGVHNKPKCYKRRAVQFNVNGVQSSIVNSGKLCGCGSTNYIDVEFTVTDDLLVNISYERLKGFWAPQISNFEIFQASDKPQPYNCVTDGSSVTPPSVSPSKGVTVTPSTSILSSPTPSPSSSEPFTVLVSESPSISPSVSVSTSSMPSESVSALATPSSSPKPSFSFEDVDIDINCGVDPRGTVIGVDNVVTSVTGPLNLANTLGLPGTSFSSYVEGASFEYTFDLPPGTYNVILGFVQPTSDDGCSGIGARVFNVLINGNMRLESYDIFSTADEVCNVAVVERFLRQTVDALDPQPLTISFQGIAGLALVAHVRVKPSLDQCVPVTTNADITDDHLAHAVPGEYPSNGATSYVDREGRGYVWVTIDGSGSHTHFSYGSRNGQVTSWTWTFPETGNVVSTSQKFVRRFPLGTTRLRLAVVDDACSRDEAETSVTVTGRMQPGAYCYYYNGVNTLPAPDTLNEFPKPAFAAVATSLSFGFPNFDFRSKGFVARCVFFIEFSGVSEDTKLDLNVGNSGIARLYKGADLVLDSNTSTNGSTSTSVGLQQFELIYHHFNQKSPDEQPTINPTLSLLVNQSVPTKVTHDQSTVLPILTAIDPDSGRVTGGARTKLSGYGLFLPLTVSFGGKNVTALSDGATANTVFVNPPAMSAGPVEVIASSKVGMNSNPVVYSYGSTCDPVAFTRKEITMSDGRPVPLGLPTVVSTWSDGKLYIGTRLGDVRVVDYDSNTLKVIDMCHSEVLRDEQYFDWTGSLSNRSILGLTFHPKDKEPRPYVSLSTLFWQRRARIERSNTRAWSNGAIIRLKPSDETTLKKDPNQCLMFDETIVRNLPVSDGDHAVNELVFTQSGDLLIAVGGNTNAGLPYSPLGGNWESYYSGAIIIARLSRGSKFNGTIDYTTPDNLRTAKPKSLDNVDIYATGVRNMFAMTMARSGHIYGADMGPNCKFGNASTSCDEYIESEAATRSDRNKVPFPGKSIVGPEGECKYGDTRKDKLLRIVQGKFYGHSNIQRAVQMSGREAECTWFDPKTDRSGKPLLKTPPSYYMPKMSFVQSPLTTIREYGANLFCGRLKGNLILSRYKGRGTWRVRLNAQGTAVNGVAEKFEALGGLRVEENIYGDLIFPRLYPDNEGILVFRPVVAARGVGVAVVNALPFRHPKTGGTKIRIGGWGFEDGVAVTVDGENCVVKEMTKTMVVCVMPPRKNNSNNLVDIVVQVGATESVLQNAVLYMNV